MVFLILFLGLGLSLLPLIIAFRRKHPYCEGITVLNLITLTWVVLLLIYSTVFTAVGEMVLYGPLTWGVVGWTVALVWSVSVPQPPNLESKNNPLHS